MLKYLLPFILLLSLVNCTEKEGKPVSSNSEIAVDLHSYSNIEEVHTTHLDLDLDVSFDKKKIYGIATHKLSEHKTDEMIFDIKDLKIVKVELDNGKETAFKIGENDELLGQPLIVSITSSTKEVKIHYETTSESDALDWLEPQLTSGKKHPFLYTQGQAIITRTWIPCQDSPQNRITYSAAVHVPNGLLAVMSADHLSERNDQGIYHFHMDQPIPSYLIALAVGDLTYHRFDDRCGIYAEPELIDACASEFEDLPEMIRIAESIYGKYEWNQYDILMLPYSFPFGGMENPRLTFANPTLLAGDKSLVSVVAHELAHSWSGNLVTNATWNDFWLNEGFTVYFENRIMEKLYGKEVADILAIIEFQDLEASLQDITESEHPEDTKLKLDLKERDPDDGMTDIAYVKGAYFLRTLEDLVGRQKFDAFLNAYFKKFSFQTLTTEEFLNYLNTELLEKEGLEFNTNEWIYQQGLPDNCVEITSSRLSEMESWARSLNNGKQLHKIKQYQRNDLTTQEWQTLIRTLSTEVPHNVLDALDQQLHFSTQANAAIQSDWFKLSARSGYLKIRPEMQQYLTKIGRRWFIEGIYQALVDRNDPEDLKFAQDVFEKARVNYHSITVRTIEEILENEK